MKTVDEIEQFHRGKHTVRVAGYQRKISAIFDKYSDLLIRLGISIKDVDPNKLFAFSSYPGANKAVQAALRKMSSEIRKTIVDGIDLEWHAANTKNDDIVKSVLGTKAGEEYFQDNEQALKVFRARKAKGLNLSSRVWKNTTRFKREVELALDRGIAEGQSAAEMGRKTRRYLREPDRLYRRIRNDRGQLVPSKAMKAYHPGQGVYRSSAKNARRMTATETNMAYRKSDILRYQQLDFIVGYEVHTSHSHKVPDMCDHLAGKYPKTFMFTGWHPLCVCYITSILKTEAERDEDSRRRLNGQATLKGSANEVKDVPKGFKKWITDNSDRIKRAKSKPYFIAENFKYGNIDKGLKSSIAKVPKPPAKPAKINLSDFFKGSHPTNAEMKNIMSDVANRRPEWFNDGFDGLYFRRSTKYMMQQSKSYHPRTGKWVSASKIAVSTFTSPRTKFNPAEELRGAFGALKTGEKLTFNQEYAVEALWHEILHARSKTAPFNLSVSQRQAMETVNQFTARHTYDELLAELGGKSIHKAKIMEEGYGYTSWINDFRKRLKSAGISEKQALKELSPILLSDYNSIQTELRKFFERHQVTAE